jgi:hypothetical protein
MAFDPTKPVQTRDGRKARILCTDRDGNRPIVVLITNSLREEVSTRCRDGRLSLGHDGFRGDLVNIPVKSTTYQSIYMNGTTGNFGAPTSDRAVFVVPNIVGYVCRDYEDGVLVKTYLVNKEEK